MPLPTQHFTTVGLCPAPWALQQRAGRLPRVPDASRLLGLKFVRPGSNTSSFTCNILAAQNKLGCKTAMFVPFGGHSAATQYFVGSTKESGAHTYPVYGIQGC